MESWLSAEGTLPPWARGRLGPDAREEEVSGPHTSQLETLSAWCGPAREPSTAPRQRHAARLAAASGPGDGIVRCAYENSLTLISTKNEANAFGY